MAVLIRVPAVAGCRNLVKQLAVRDLKLRYERSALGFFWSLLNPLIMIAIYTFFFSIVIKVGVPRYPVFLVSVLLPWQFLARGMFSVAPSVYYSGYLLNRSVFPVEALVFSGMLSSFVDFCLEMTVLGVILLLFGCPLFPGVLIVPLVMLLHLLFTTGVAMILSVAYVFYRDTQYITNIISTAWMYITPVFYSIYLVPERYLSVYKLNPMVHIAGAFREPLYTGSFPHPATLAYAAFSAVGMFMFGWFIFNRYKRSFAEVL